MYRAVLLSMLSIALVVAGCGGTKSYSLADTRACLEALGVDVGGKLGDDVVAKSATGGAFAAKLGDNSVKVVFGETENDAKGIEQGYDRFAFQNVKAGLPDVLHRYKNVVTLWGAHPQESDLALVVGCLK